MAIRFDDETETLLNDMERRLDWNFQRFIAEKVDQPANDDWPKWERWF